MCSERNADFFFCICFQNFQNCKRKWTRLSYLSFDMVTLTAATLWAGVCFQAPLAKSSANRFAIQKAGSVVLCEGHVWTGSWQKAKGSSWAARVASVFFIFVLRLDFISLCDALGFFFHFFIIKKVNHVIFWWLVVFEASSASIALWIRNGACFLHSSLYNSLFLSCPDWPWQHMDPVPRVSLVFSCVNIKLGVGAAWGGDEGKCDRCNHGDTKL